MRDKEYEAELQRRLTVYQSVYDSALEPFGRRAPAPTLGVGANEFRRSSLTQLKQFLPPGNPWRDASLNNLKAGALDVIQKEILDGLRTTARDPRLMALTPAARPDPMDPAIKAVKVVRGGKEFTEFYGEHFVRSMSRPGRRVAYFNGPYGPITTDGRRLSGYGKANGGQLFCLSNRPDVFPGAATTS
jgi:hypothetical protein